MSCEGNICLHSCRAFYYPTSIVANLGVLKQGAVYSKNVGMLQLRNCTCHANMASLLAILRWPGCHSWPAMLSHITQYILSNKIALVQHRFRRNIYHIYIVCQSAHHVHLMRNYNFTEAATKANPI